MSPPYREGEEDSARGAPADAESAADPEGRVLSVHFGRSANCSSVGSVVDVLFLSSAAGASVLAGLALYLRNGSGSGSGSADGNGNGNGNGNGESTTGDADGNDGGTS